MSKREEQKIREELNKAVLKEFRTCIKKTDWRKYQNSMFRVESSYFFDSNFYVYLIKNKTIFKLEVKPYETDNIFWEIMQMESNKKEPLSLRSNGSFVCSSLPIIEYEFDDEGCTPTEIAQSFVSWAKMNMETFIEESSSTLFSDKIKTNEAFIEKGSYSDTLICTLITENKFEEAKQLTDEIISTKRPKTCDYINNSVSFYENARTWIENNA